MDYTAKQGYVYILANKKHGTLYVGVTSNIAQRCHQHKTGNVKGFTSKYGVKKLVYCEVFDNMLEAIAREKAIKKWARAWKIEIIEKSNPTWRDLSVDIAC